MCDTWFLVRSAFVLNVDAFIDHWGLVMDVLSDLHIDKVDVGDDVIPVGEALVYRVIGDTVASSRAWSCQQVLQKPTSKEVSNARVRAHELVAQSSGYERGCI